VDKHKYRKTERLLYDSKTLDQAIANISAEIEARRAELMPQEGNSVVKTGGGSTRDPFKESQPEQYSIKLEEDRELQRLMSQLRLHKQRREAIREAKRYLTDEENTLIRLKYDLEKSNREVWETMCLSRRSYFYMKHRVVEKVARWLGS